MRTTQRKTVLGYTKASADKLTRALAAAARCEAIASGEVLLLRDQLLATRRLVARLERVKR